VKEIKITKGVKRKKYIFYLSYLISHALVINTVDQILRDTMKIIAPDDLVSIICEVLEGLDL
jgi:hypothetical protein